MSRGIFFFVAMFLRPIALPVFGCATAFDPMIQADTKEYRKANVLFERAFAFYMAKTRYG